MTRVSVIWASPSLLNSTRISRLYSFGLAKAVVLAGKDFAESKEMAKTVRNAFPDLYLYLGGGADMSNLKEAYDCFDGIFVASCLKDTGNMTGRLDQEKLKAFMDLYHEIIR